MVKNSACNGISGPRTSQLSLNFSLQSRNLHASKGNITMADHLLTSMSESQSAEELPTMTTTTTTTIAHPAIVSQDEWLTARKKLLTDEKELTAHYDRVNAERRRLPMVKIEKNYVFDGTHGKLNLKELFEGRR